MDLRAITNELKYIAYYKWNYALSLPLSAVTAANFYLGGPAYGIRDTLLSLMLLYTIGKHRAFNQELRQEEIATRQRLNGQEEIMRQGVLSRIHDLETRLTEHIERTVLKIREVRRELGIINQLLD